MPLYIAPLVLRNDDGKIYVVGIVSWGGACGYDEYPMVHADVTNHINLEWIHETLGKAYLKLIKLFEQNNEIA